MSHMQKQLLTRWMHSHEEDSATEMVFRPASFDFPPSRGRIGFDLKADGSYVDLGTGPDDGPVVADGTWNLDEHNLTLHCDAPPGGDRTLHIVSCEPDRLVVKK